MSMKLVAVITIASVVFIQGESISVRTRPTSWPTQPYLPQVPLTRYSAPGRDMAPMWSTESETAIPEQLEINESPKLVIRKFIRSEDPSSQNQGRFFSWLFGSGGYNRPVPPYRPPGDHGLEYCVEYVDPYTGYATEDCTPIIL